MSPVENILECIDQGFLFLLYANIIEYKTSSFKIDIFKIIGQWPYMCIVWIHTAHLETTDKLSTATVNPSHNNINTLYLLIMHEL